MSTSKKEREAKGKTMAGQASNFLKAQLRCFYKVQAHRKHLGTKNQSLRSRLVKLFLSKRDHVHVEGSQESFLSLSKYLDPLSYSTTRYSSQLTAIRECYISRPSKVLYTSAWTHIQASMTNRALLISSFVLLGTSTARNSWRVQSIISSTSNPPSKIP